MPKKITIASLINDLGLGGMARQVVAVDAFINREVFNHVVITLGARDLARQKDIRPGNFFAAQTSGDVVRILKEQQVDVLLVHRHGRPDRQHDAIAAALEDETMAVIEINIFSGHDEGVFGKRCDTHILQTRTNILKYSLQNGIPFDFAQQKILHTLIDVQNFENKAPSVEAVARYKIELGIRPNDFVIGRLARPVMEKWDDSLLIMWKKVSQNPRIKFLIYGVPEIRAQLLAACGRSENLIVKDPTSSDEELSLFYATINVLVHASPIGECSCTTIAETMIFSKPVIVTSTPFPRHTFGRLHTRDNGQVEQIENGVNGYVVNNGAAMAVAIQNLFENPEIARKMGARNRRDVITQYDARVGIKTLEKICLESVLKKKSISPEAKDYFNSIAFFPDEPSIRAWPTEYRRRIREVFGAAISYTLSEQMYLWYLKLGRKLASVQRRFTK